MEFVGGIWSEVMAALSPEFINSLMPRMSANEVVAGEFSRKKN